MQRITEKRNLLFLVLFVLLLTPLAILPAWAAPNTTTKILFVQGNSGKDLGLYKTFLNGVYAGQTIVYSGDSAADKYAFTTSAQQGVFTPAQLARLNDADLVIVTPDITQTDLLVQGWNPTYAPVDWNCINVPLMVHNSDIVGNVSYQNGYTNQMGYWGWTEGNFGSVTLSYGPGTTGAGGGAAVPNGSVCVSVGLPNAWPANWNTITTDPFYTGITTVAGLNSSTWFQLVQNANYKVGTLNGNHQGGSATGGTELAASYYDHYTGNDVIYRVPQDGAFSKPFRKAGSRRMYFAMADRNNVDGVNSFLGDAVNGATANGKMALTNAMLYLYNPANGRRPIPFAGGPNTRVNILTGQTSVNYTVADATYSDGEGGTVGTLQWSLAATDSRNEGSETIVSGATTLTPQFNFTKQGVYTATLKATKANLDYVISQRTFTVGAATAPYIATINPREGRMVANLTAPVTVTFDHAVTFTGPNLVLTVTGGTPSPATINGTTTNNTTFSFDCSGITLSGTNTQVLMSLDTSTVKDGIDGILPFATPTYTWGYVYNNVPAPGNPAGGMHPIVLCSNRGAASDAAYISLLTNLYGTGTVVTTLDSAHYNPQTSPYNWDANTAALLQSASLVILDSSEGSGLPSGGPTTNGLNHAQWLTLAAPVLTNDSYFCASANIAMCYSRGGSSAYNPLTENYIDSPFYEGVPMRGDGLMYELVNDLTGVGYMNYATGGSGNAYTYGTPTGTSLGFTSFGNETQKTGMYWPANVKFVAGGTTQAAGRRIVTPLSDHCATNLWTGVTVTGGFVAGTFTPAGMTLVANEHKYFAQPTGAPTVVWKDMDTLVRHKLDHVTVRFDRAITTPGALTITGSASGPIYTTSVAPTTTDNMTFVYSGIPASTWVGKGTQTLTFAINVSTVHETESGYNLPCITGASNYTWQSCYDPSKLRVHIGVLDNAREDYDMAAYTNLVQSYYGSSTWVEWLQIQGTNGANTAPWSQTFMDRLNACDMLIIGDNQQNAGWYGPTYWVNTLVPNGGVTAWTKPIVNGWPSNYAGTLAQAGNWFSVTPSGGGNGSDTQVQALNAATPAAISLFAGVNFTSGKSTVLTRVFTNSNQSGLNYVPVTASGLTIAGAIGATGSNANNCFAAYAPAGSLLYTGTGSTITHAGPRAFNSLLASVHLVETLTADGKTIFRNQLGMMLPLIVPPSVVSTTPAATSSVSGLPTVVLTFSAPVLAAGGAGTGGTLKLNGTTITGSGVGSNGSAATGYTVWTFTVPTAQIPAPWPNNPDALTASVDLTGFYETGTGMLLPPTSPYTWSFTLTTPARPNILSATPGSTPVLITAPTQVVLTSDLGLTGLGALKFNGSVIHAPLAGTNGGKTWTYTIPANQYVNMVGTINASVDLTTATETLSGVNMHFAASPYTWSFTFDPSKWQGKIVLVSNSNTADDHSAYVSFLTNTVYSTTLYPNGVQIEDIRGKYYPLTTALRDSLNASANVVAILPFNNVSTLAGTTGSPTASQLWNSITKPMILHNSDLANYGNWGWGRWNAGNGTYATDATGSFQVENTTAAQNDPILAGLDQTTAPGRVQYFLTQTSVYAACLNDTTQGGQAISGLDLVYDGNRAILTHWAPGHYLGAALFLTENANEPNSPWFFSDAIRGADQPVPADRVMMALGPYTNVGGNYGVNDVSGFFDPVTGARANGAKLALQNAFRMMFDPSKDLRIASAIVPASCTPAAGLGVGTIPKIVVHFTLPVTGVKASDLSVNPSSALFPTPWVATSVQAMSGDPVLGPSTDWTFDGAWTNPAIGLTIPLETTINVKFNGLDSPTLSHVTDTVNHLGVVPAQWSFLLTWIPAPANVPQKVWTLYE